MEQSSILSTRFDCPVVRLKFSLSATAHECETKSIFNLIFASHHHQQGYIKPLSPNPSRFVWLVPSPISLRKVLSQCVWDCSLSAMFSWLSDVQSCALSLKDFNWSLHGRKKSELAPSRQGKELGFSVTRRFIPCNVAAVYKVVSIDRFHVTSLPPCWRTITKDFLIGFYC